MNNQLDPQNSEHKLAHVSSNEVFDELFFAHVSSKAIDDQDEQRGWPGDGSGQDDLADYNQNESMDYLNE